MIELRDYQIQAVNELLDKAITLLSSNTYRQKLVLKAPTGAGKTVIMGDWLKRMAQTLPGMSLLSCKSSLTIFTHINSHVQPLGNRFGRFCPYTEPSKLYFLKVLPC